MNYLIRYNPKYKNLTKVFLETLSEIPFGDLVTFKTKNDKKISRHDFKCSSWYCMSPRDYVLKLKKLNSRKVYDYGDSVIFSGLEPFTLKKLTKRQEIDWWIHRLSRKEKYPNKKEKQWMYQYYGKLIS